MSSMKKRPANETLMSKTDRKKLKAVRRAEEKQAPVGADEADEEDDEVQNTSYTVYMHPSTNKPQPMRFCAH